MAATWRTGVGMVLVSSAVSVSASASALTEPLICYILDGVLLVYCIIATVLFFRVKWCKPSTEPPIEDTYAELKPGANDEYEDLTKTAATWRKRTPEASSDYQALQVTEDNSDAYQVIATKGRKKKTKPPPPPSEEIQPSEESPPPLPPH